MLSEFELEQGCRQVVCSSGLSTERGKCQKTCQLTWYPLLPAIALVVYSSIYLVLDVATYTEKMGYLHATKDIEAAAVCMESVQRIQTLRYTATLYLGSDSRVHSFERFVDDAFAATSDALSEAWTTNKRPGQPCDFEQLVKEYFSEINFGQTDIYIDDETLKNFCTLADFVQASLGQMKNLTVTFQKEALPRVSSTFSLLIDLMLVDCMKHVAYYGRSLYIIQSVDRYHGLVDLEKTYSRMLTIGAVYFSRGHLEQTERRAMLANLRLADDYVSFDQLDDVVVPDTVRTIVIEVLEAVDEQGRTRATSFGLVRWSETLQAFVTSLDEMVNDELNEMKRRIAGEKTTIGWRVGFGIFAWVARRMFVWVAVLTVLLPVVTVNATRAMTTIRIYSRSFSSKERELRTEKHKTEALLNEMLPRSQLCSLT